MNLPELLRWQWEGYAGYHRSRTNLLLHICVVPLFWVGTVLLVMGLLGLAWVELVVGAACMLVSVAAQGQGHKLEPTPPAPFTGPGNFVARLFLEQWITFPRFVLAGLWARNLAAGRDDG